ncbi:MAG: hypothetical protein IPK59_19320 [Rhodospirillaceae bacterium]|nr:hypothetical protein [Rhodospirillaceae bacterium]
MSDAGDLLEAILRIFGRIIGWVARLLFEFVVEVLFEFILRLGEAIAAFLQRCRLPRWLAGLLAFLLVLAMVAAPIALLIALLRFAA